MLLDQLKPNIIVRGPIFPEPVQVIVAIPMGTSVKLVGKGLNTNQVHEPILSAEQLAQLVSSPEREPFDGDPLRFRLGVEALRLGLAYEYDPYFSLSIARVDPLPHQLEAVYDYFLTMPRIRFLLADDPGAGKTIMAGLLLKELKIRGLVKRTLIITPASLSFQWQREMKEKFREQFEVIRSDVLRANYGMNPWQERNQVVTSISWVCWIETCTATSRASKRLCGGTTPRFIFAARKKPSSHSQTPKLGRSRSFSPTDSCIPLPSIWMVRNTTSTTHSPGTSKINRSRPRRKTLLEAVP